MSAADGADPRHKPEALRERIRSTLARNPLANRYMFHPLRLDAIVEETARSIVRFIDTGARSWLFETGEGLARNGLSAASIIDLIAAIGELRAAKADVNDGVKALVEGYVAYRERQILSDQEQLRRALANALESQRRDLLVKNQAIDSSINGIMIADMDGRIGYVNRSFLSMWGYRSTEEVTGRLIGELLEEESGRKIAERFPLIGGWSGELQARRHDDGTFTVSVSTSIVRDASGEPVGMMVFFVDVTESRRLELQVQQIQKMDDLGQLAGGIVHDFNNLLAAISGYVQMVMLQASTQGQMYQDLLQIKAAVDRGAGLTQQLGLFTRQATGRRQVISLNDVAADTYELLKYTFPQNIEVQMDLDPAPWSIEADPNQMSQVVMNLCVNARDAMLRKADGAAAASIGTLTIETSNFELSEAAARQYVDVGAGKYVRLRISDTGVGIAPEVRNRIFVPFVTTKGAKRGTGLGLAVVYGIVRSHRGFIDVASTTGVGSTFVVYLPTAGAVADSAQHDLPAVELERGEGTLLVVDDEVQVREVISRALTYCGYRVLQAENGQTAIECYRDHRSEIDLVILDMVMPDMSGHDALLGLRKIDPAVVALFLTGYTGAGRLRAMAEQEGAQVMEKPVELRVLSRRVKELLGR